MNKEELNKEIEKLKVSLEAHEEQVKDLQRLLEVAEKKLIDADKPKLTVKQLQVIENAIDKTIKAYEVIKMQGLGTPEDLDVFHSTQGQYDWPTTNL